MVLAVRQSALATVYKMTQGDAEPILEYVGSESATANSFALVEGNGIARPGGAIGYVGVPHNSGHNLNLGRLGVEPRSA